MNNNKPLMNTASSGNVLSLQEFTFSWSWELHLRQGMSIQHESISGKVTLMV